jgi:UDP-GlcNAc3NAcA epimerase
MAVCRHRIIHSGQHYDYNMSQAFFDQLHLPSPDINLNVGSGPHGRQTGRIMERCEKALISLRPQLALVYGDTNTTLAGALAAAKLGIPVGHVEAGLRSYRMTMPEEINRRMTDHLSSLLFYPTPTARKNLLAEGITRGLINSGDVMYEILDTFLPLVQKRKGIFPQMGIKPGEYILITLHRAENVDDPKNLHSFVSILRGLDGPKVFPAHPRVKSTLRRLGFAKEIASVPDLITCRPQPYIESLALISSARAIMTDSGGMQKEAFFLGVPCLTLRNETEWVETVSAGANVLVGLSYAKIKRALKNLQPHSARKRGYTVRGKKPSAIIAEAVAQFLDSR